MKKKMTLLLDADVLLYEVVHQTLRIHEVGDGKFQTIGDAKEAASRFAGRVADLMEQANAHKTVACFSSHGNTFRHSTVDPGYKKGRTKDKVERKRPIHFFPAKDRIMEWAKTQENISTATEPWLEADDILGLLATVPESNTVICTIDKDLRSVPGKHLHLRTGVLDVVTPFAAEKFFYSQTLSGDSVDDIPGCKGIGVIRAGRIINAALDSTLNTCAATIPRKVWETIVETYEKAGQTEEDAVRNARLVRILQHGQYDWVTKEIVLWEPPHLTSAS